MKCASDRSTGEGGLHQTIKTPAVSHGLAARHFDPGQGIPPTAASPPLWGLPSAGDHQVSGGPPKPVSHTTASSVFSKNLYTKVEVSQISYCQDRQRKAHNKCSALLRVYDNQDRLPHTISIIHIDKQAELHLLHGEKAGDPTGVQFLHLFSVNVFIAFNLFQLGALEEHDE